jgi:hypothetical protein
LRSYDAATGQRFNVECMSRGLVCHPDVYYRSWPSRTTAEEEQHFGWLVSLAPREELAWFLACRGHCLLDSRRFREAAEAYARACELAAPRHSGYEGCLAAALNRWQEHLRPRLPPTSPRPPVRPTPRRFPGIAAGLEDALTRLQAEEVLVGQAPRGGR